MRLDCAPRILSAVVRKGAPLDQSSVAVRQRNRATTAYGLVIGIGKGEVGLERRAFDLESDVSANPECTAVFI